MLPRHFKNSGVFQDIWKTNPGPQTYKRQPKDFLKTLLERIFKNSGVALSYTRNKKNAGDLGARKVRQYADLKFTKSFIIAMYIWTGGACYLTEIIS